MPAVSTANVARPFEFVLLDSPELNRPPDPDAFAEYFTSAGAEVAVFSNLGGDAVMVVPCPMAESSAYGHLAALCGVRRNLSVRSLALGR